MNYKKAQRASQPRTPESVLQTMASQFFPGRMIIKGKAGGKWRFGRSGYVFLHVEDEIALINPPPSEF